MNHFPEKKKTRHSTQLIKKFHLAITDKKKKQQQNKPTKLYLLLYLYTLRLNFILIYYFVSMKPTIMSQRYIKNCGQEWRIMMTKK